MQSHDILTHSKLDLPQCIPTKGPYDPHPNAT